jgi:hypothetical protein
MMKPMRFMQLVAALAIACTATSYATAEEKNLVGYWKLRGDCRDYSGHDHHGKNHGVDLETGAFDGRDAYIEIPDTKDFAFDGNDFSIAAEVSTDANLDDFFGSLLSKFDPEFRRGFHLSFTGNSSGYNAQSDTRQLAFGIDQNSSGTWTDHGRPGGNTQICDALTVFEGDLYAGTTDGDSEDEWAHVYRLREGEGWEDCGRLGNERTRGVYAMVVHNGELYAATSSSHGPQPADLAFGSVYRYCGGQEWENIGQPGKNFRLNSLASYDGKLYVAAFNIGPDPGHAYVYEGDKQWRKCGEFSGWPHAFVVHDGRLYTAYPRGEVYAYDGNEWENLGNPLGKLAECNQIHSLGAYRGNLLAGIWPSGKVAMLHDGKWSDTGRLGDATEVVALATYNGSLYGGTIPRAELMRFDGRNGWTSVRRLFDPSGFTPVPVGSGAKEVEDWTRASSLAVYQGKLFVTTATCYRTKIDGLPPEDIRGNVFAYESGACTSFDQDLGPGWKHVAAVRKADQLQLFVDGDLVTTASIGEPLDVATDVPLKIGAGPHGYFNGKLRDVRLYGRAISVEEIVALSAGEAKALADNLGQ